jgi:hypothetical protein
MEVLGAKRLKRRPATVIRLAHHAPPFRAIWLNFQSQGGGMGSGCEPRQNPNLPNLPPTFWIFLPKGGI